MFKSRWLCLLGMIPAAAAAQSMVVERSGSTIVFEPYAPNIIRVTLSLSKEPATAPPGYGFVARANDHGWTRQGDAYRSARMTVTLQPDHPGKPLATEHDIAKFFNGSAPSAHITVATAGGQTLTDMTGWSMSEPNYKDGNAGVLHDRRPSDAP